MASQEPVKVSKKELEHAQKLWSNFGVATKWSIYLIVIILVAMAIFLL